MTRFIRGLVGTLSALALFPGPAAMTARASFNTAPGSPHKITYKTFLHGGFVAVNPIKSVAFNSGGKHPIKGTILSRVFKSGSTYAYLYQVQIANITANTGKTLKTFTVAPWKALFGSFTFDKTKFSAFQITDLGRPQANTSGFIFPGSTVPFTSVKGTDGSSLVGNFLTSGNTLRRGTTSAVLVVFSTKAPAPVAGDLHGTPNGATTGTVDGGVYVPAPEPASLLMLALGGVGLAGAPLWRRRREVKLS